MGTGQTKIHNMEHERVVGSAPRLRGAVCLCTCTASAADQSNPVSINNKFLTLHVFTVEGPLNHRFSCCGVTCGAGSNVWRVQHDAKVQLAQIA